MLYELINPSDSITFEAETFELAALATFLVGNGAYGATPITDDENAKKVPVLLLGMGVDEWIKQEFDCTIEEFFERTMEEVSTVLLSFATVSVRERQIYELALSKITDEEKRIEFLAEWDDKRRSSIAQITNRAHELGRNIKVNPRKSSHSRPTCDETATT